MWPKCSAPWSLVKLMLVVLNLISTCLMIFTGLREDPISSYVTGRYDYIRQRMIEGSINTEIAEPDHYRLHNLPTPVELADYTFITTPRRDPESIGEYRSVCTNINTNSAPLLISYNDDYWGKGPRRVQIYVYSISAPNCQVVTVKPAWRDKCIADRQGNATLCHQFVLENFDKLLNDQSARLLVPKDFGAKGVPFLRCSRRPLAPFSFKADLLAHQTYWSGGAWHVTIQSSDCLGVPLVRSPDQLSTLFQSKNVDEAANMLVMLPPDSWFPFIIRWLHSFVTIVMITRGLLLALFHSNTARYLPHAIRFGASRKWLRYMIPFMPAIIHVSENERAVVTFKGSLLLGSDVWMSHWLYMWLSILDAICNIRLTYVIFQVATSLMIMKFTLVTFIFVCESITRMSWMMCLVQTLVRMLLKAFARLLRALRLIRSTTREKIEWAVDSSSMFLSYRIYNVMMFAIILILLEVKGNPSFQVRANPYKVGAYGGIIEISRFWQSEVACDLTTLLAILTVAGQVFGLGLLCTKYRLLCDNSVLRLLQKRYWLSGWDGFMAANLLGLDPYDEGVVIDGLAYTKTSTGSLLQLLYMSGPSGFVQLGGDYIFHDGGFSLEPIRFKYPVPKAMSMGLIGTGNGSVISKGTGANSSDVTQGPQSYAVKPKEEASGVTPGSKRSIFERQLRVVSEGYFGRVLLIDLAAPGQTTTNKETGRREFEVTDALTTMTILDIKWILGSKEKKLRIL